MDSCVASTPHASARSSLLFVVVTLFFATLCSIFILHPFTPGFPSAGLDPSWVVVLGEQAASHARWGIDLDFTYGPASPLVTGYYNSQYLSLTLPLLLFFCLVHGSCAAVLLLPRRTRGADRGWARLIALSCYAVALLATRINPDGFYFSTTFLVFLVDLDRETNDRLARIVVVAGVVATGIFAISKLSFGIAALPLFLLADLRGLYRRRLPWRLLLSAIAFVAADLAYGQRLSDLPHFLLTQKDIIGGYTEAMSTPGSRYELLAFLVSAAVLVIVTLIVEVRTPRSWPDRLLLPVGLVAILLLVFKAGFVRQDLHTLITWTSSGLFGLMIALNRVAPRYRFVAGALTLGSLFVLVVVCPYLVVIATEDRPSTAAMLDIYQSWLFNGPPDEIEGMRSAVTDPKTFVASLDENKAKAWADMRSKSTLPHFAGSIDIIQSDQSTIIAQGLDYHPRPSFQEYFTYAPGLMAANRAFYEGDKAPDWVLFAPGSIDDRSPMSAEGALWPLFLRRYEPVRLVDEQVALHRRQKTDAEIVGEWTTRKAHFDETVPLDPNAGAVFARITVRPTVLGRLETLLYRPPMLNLAVKYASGQEASYRFIPNLGAGGFLLSPLVASASDYVHLSFGDLDSLKDGRVVEVRIVGNKGARLAFKSEIDFEFAPLNLKALSRGIDSQPLYQKFESTRSWRDLVGRLGRKEDLQGDRLTFQPPNNMSVRTNGARHIRVKYGIETDAWKRGNPDGVCFSLGSEAKPNALWRRCLDPSKVEADRNEQSVEIDLPSDADVVSLKTQCRIGCDWAWSYISQIELVP